MKKNHEPEKQLSTTIWRDTTYQALKNRFRFCGTILCGVSSVFIKADPRTDFAFRVREGEKGFLGNHKLAHRGLQQSKHVILQNVN